jgi:hypothetical protein
MGDKFSRVSGLHYAEHKTFPAGYPWSITPRNRSSLLRVQAPVWADEEKRASRNAGLFFVILLRTATTFQCELLTGDQRRSRYLPLVSTFCFSSSFIFLIVGSGLASPVV